MTDSRGSDGQMFQAVTSGVIRWTITCYQWRIQTRRFAGQSKTNAPKSLHLFEHRSFSVTIGGYHTNGYLF